MTKRARMGALAQILVDSPDRTEQPTPTAPKHEAEPKTVKQKTVKPAFGKLAEGRIGSEAAGKAIEVQRPYGERGDFEKVTVTLPSDVRAMLLDESLRRKKDHSPNWPIAAIVREAIAAYLSSKQ